MYILPQLCPACQVLVQLNTLPVLQTSRGKVFEEKLGSGEAEQATTFGESNSAQFIRLPRKTTALAKAAGETPINKVQ